ncbi:MAG TPA: hypothetical protein VFW28_03580 [Micropepsaceae bacterium]|nr:hypothetical protein [Micropepsaceae bacterium]
MGYSDAAIPGDGCRQNLTLRITVIKLLGWHAAFEYGANTTIRNP